MEERVKMSAKRVRKREENRDESKEVMGWL